VSLEQTKRDDRRGLAIVAAVTLGLFVALAVWAKYSSPADWELQALTTLAAPPGPLAVAVSALNGIGNLPVWAVVIAIFSLIVGFVRGLAAAVLVALTFASDLVAFLVKVLVERDRPDTTAVRDFFGPDNFSYPSGHTVRATALVAVLIWLFAPAKLRLPLAVVGGVAAGLVMGYARVALGVHWPTDVIGGALLGLGWFAVTAALIWVQPSEKTEGAKG
jgi:membrane-associated phospholipid phosphatase